MIESVVKTQWKRAAGAEGKTAREIKVHVKDGGERWRESGQTRKDDKGNLLTEEVFKILLKQILTKE